MPGAPRADMLKPIVHMKSTSDAGSARAEVSLIAGRPGAEPRADGSRPVLAFKVTSPSTGRELESKYFCATKENVEQACEQAWEAFYALRSASPHDRAQLLDRIGQMLSDLGDELVYTAAAETGFSPVRLVAERERCAANCAQLAEVVRSGAWCRPSIDQGEAARRPIPKPDLRRMLRPLGPVAVMGSASSPLLTGAAGSDAMSALAAGCPVVYKAHPQLPGTTLLIAKMIASAIDVFGPHPGCFSTLLAGGSKAHTVAVELVRNECIRAVGFTGTRAVGDQIVRLAQTRDDPIPVFALMGGINPVFVLPGAVESSGAIIAERLFLSISNATGQSCVRPGLIFMARGGEMEALVRSLADAMNRLDPQVMVSREIRDRYIARFEQIAQLSGVELRGGSPQGGHRSSAYSGASDAMPVCASPGLFRTTFATFQQHATLHEEVFGPSAILVITDTPEHLTNAAASIQGCLTASVWCHASDEPLAARLSTILDVRAGRVVFNGVATGLELCPSLVHGGPYPASSQPFGTAAGPDSILRWARPTCYQNAPTPMLPQELRDANPLGVTRQLDGRPSSAAISRKRPTNITRAA